jgi:hypothetical protein
MRIFSHLGYKLAALALALILWAAAQGLRSVEETIDVPVALESVPEDVIVVGQSAREINLRLVGSRAALRRAARELDYYAISLAGATAPDFHHAVTTEGFSIPRGARILFRSPSSVRVKLEQIVSKTVPVRADLVGTPPEGYTIAGVNIEPAQVTLRGAPSELRRVQYVTTDRVDVSRLRATLEQEVRLVLTGDQIWRDDDGERVRVQVEVNAPPDGDEAGTPQDGG